MRSLHNYGQLSPIVVCRREETPVLIEEARDDLRLGLLSVSAARQLIRLPAGNQAELMAAMRRPQTKGKVERPFHYVESSLLNGRTFRSLDHLNEVAAWWLANVADVRIHRETKQTPLARHQEELPHLVPLPQNPYDTAEYQHLLEGQTSKGTLDGENAAQDDTTIDAEETEDDRTDAPQQDP